MKKAHMLAATALVALLSSPALAEPVKIGVIINNAIGEVGWEHEMERGVKAVQDKFGDKVKVNTVSGVGEGPDATRVMNKMAVDGSNLLFLTSFGHMNDGLRLARKDPKLDIVHIGGYINEPNFATFTVRHYEASYLCGMAAGFATKSQQLGVVAAFPLPEVLNIMNAWVLGAQSVNPNLKPVKVVWLNSWFDPTKEKSAAESLVTQGSDVLYSLFPGTPSTVSTAEQLGVGVTVTLSDATKFAPKHHLCAAQANFGPGFIQKVQEVMDGKFKGNDTFAGIKDNAVAVAGLGQSLTEDQKKQILAKQEAIRDGSFQPFKGPIAANDGKQAVAADAALDDKQIKSMNFLVKGIDTTIPKKN